MPGPQSTLFFLLLLGTFGLLTWWLIVARQLVFRVLAACLAFIPAMMFGVAAVNKYYDYYQNWSSAIADLTNQGIGTQVPKGKLNIASVVDTAASRKIAMKQGELLQLTVTDPAIRMTRTVLVYLPPEYFDPAYSRYRFPAIELLHGFPGQPQEWISLLHANTTLNNLVREHKGAPAVLVIPNANGPNGVSLQCLNQYRGPQDATFLAGFLPGYIAAKFRVMPPGKAWGIAGYSEGGFCAANLGLNYFSKFSYAGVLSGYFRPSQNQVGSPPRLVSPFGSVQQARRNTPLDLIQALPVRDRIPRFWLGAGSADPVDIRAAQLFATLVQLRQPGVVLREVPGGGHTMYTWRALLPPMLSWMTEGIAYRAMISQPRADLPAFMRSHLHGPVLHPKPSPSGSAAPHRKARR